MHARSLLILLEEGDHVVVAAAAGEVEAGAVGGRIAVAGSPLGGVLRSGRPERLTDLSGPLLVSPREMNATTALIVPLIFRNEKLGALAAFDRTLDGPQFSADDARLMQSFAASAATAVQTAKSVAEERLKRSIEASEQERRRWARELHDYTLQGLGALQLLLSSALQRESNIELERAARQAIEQIGTQIENLRSVISELRPAALDELGLEPAIEGLVERTQAAQGFSVQTRLELGGDVGRLVRLAPEIATAIYRLVQEALNNVAKHARAQNVEVSVKEVDGGIEVEVRDDGVGFDPDANGGGFGLTGTYERVELAGGRLTVSSSPGEGTTVRALLPVREAADVG